jgi:hypothetical protein
MLLVVVVGCLVPAGLARAQDLSKAQAAVVRELEKLGARIDFVYDFKGVTQKLISMSVGVSVDAASAELVLKKLKQLPQVKSLSLGGPEIDAAALAHVAGLTQLRALSVGGDMVTDQGMKSVGQLTQLEELSVASTKVTDEGMKSIGRLSKLRQLHLFCTALTDTGVKELHGLTGIEQLSITHYDVSDAAIAALKAKMPRLKAGVDPYPILRLPALMKPLSVEVTAKDDPGRRLAKQRFNAAHEAFRDLCPQVVRDGAFADITFYRILDGLIDSAVKLGDCPERDLVLERSIPMLQTLSDLHEARFKDGKFNEYEIACSLYERLTLELRVLKARQGKAGPK